MATLNNFYEAIAEASTTTTGPNTAAVSSGSVSLAAGTYLVLWNCDISTTLASVAGNVIARTRDATPTTLAQNVVLEGFQQDTSPPDYFSTGGAYTFTLGGTTAVTHTINYGPESAGTCKIKNARIVVLLLEASDKVATLSGYVAGSDQVTTTNATATDTGLTLAFTPGTSGDYLVMAFAELNNSATTAAAYMLINDGSSTIETGNAPRRTTDYRSVAQVWKRTYAASAQSIKIQYRTTTATTTTTAARRLLLVALRLDAFANASHTALGADSGSNSSVYGITASLTDYRRQRNHLSIFCWPETTSGTGASIYGKATDNVIDVSEHVREPTESTNSRWSNFDILVSNVSDGFNQYTASISRKTEAFAATVLGGSGGATITVLDVGALETLALKSTQSYLETAYNINGTLKVTQAYIEAAYNKLATLKQTQTYIEVVRGSLTWSKVFSIGSANRTELIMAATIGATHRYTKPIHVLSNNTARTARAITKKIAILTTNVTNLVRSTVRIIKAVGHGQTIGTNRLRFKFKSAISSALAEIIGRKKSVLKLVQPSTPQTVVAITPQPVQHLAKTVAVAQVQITAALRSIGKIIRTTTPDVLVLQLIRTVNKLIVTTQVQSIRVLRNMGKALAVAQGAGVSKVLSINKAIAAAQSLVGSSTIMLVKLLSVSLTQAQSMTMLRLVSKLIAFAQSQITILLRSTGKLIRAATAQATSRQAGAARVLALSQGQNTVVIRGTYKVLAVAQGQIDAVLRGVGKSMSVIQAQTDNLVRGSAKMLRTAQTQVSSMLRSLTRQIGLTDAQSVSRQTRIAKVVTVAESLAADLNRSVGKVVTVALSQIGGVGRGLVAILRVVQPQGATLLRTLGKQISSADAQSVSRRDQIGKAITSAQVVVAASVQGVSKLIVLTHAVVANAVALSIGAAIVINKTLSAAQVQVANGARAVPKLIARSLTLSVNLVKRYNMRVALAWPSSLNFVRRINKRIAGVLPQTARNLSARPFSRSVFAGQNVTLSRSAGKKIAVAPWSVLTTTATAISKLVLVTTPQTVVTSVQNLRTIAVAQSQFTVLSSTIAKLFAWTQGLVGSLALATKKPISTTLTGTINYVNTFGKVIATGWPRSLAFISQRTFQIALTQSQAPALVRQTGKLLGLISTQASAVVRRVNKRLAIAQASAVVGGAIRTVRLAVILGLVERLRRVTQHRVGVAVPLAARLRKAVAKRVAVRSSSSLRLLRSVGKRIRTHLSPVASLVSFFISGVSIYGLSVGAAHSNTINMVWLKAHGVHAAVIQPMPLDVTKAVSKTIRLSNGLVGALAAAIRLRRKLQMMLAFFR